MTAKVAAIASHVLTQNQAIAQSKQCDRPNPKLSQACELLMRAIAPHVLKQKEAIRQF